MERISKHISFDEATLSNTALRAKIDNTPTPEVLESMNTLQKIYLNHCVNGMVSQ
jgi:hypothetical protein